MTKFFESQRRTAALLESMGAYYASACAYEQNKQALASERVMEKAQKARDKREYFLAPRPPVVRKVKQVCRDDFH